METIFFTTLIFFTILSLISPSRANDFGFSVDLIHRDSSQSPFYNPSLTPFDHLNNNFIRSYNRVNHFISACEKLDSSEIIPDTGAYLMKISLGTPKFKIFAIADTGSDLIWTQCAPCTQCYKQKAPLFEPKKSSTYKKSPCNSYSCVSLSRHYCTKNHTCEYSVSYGDKSHSRGTLASETLTLGSVSLPKINFGCGFDNGGTFDENGSGIVGLGGGFNSLISQLKSSVHGKFSYCLNPALSKKKSTGLINFGNTAVVSGAKVVSTPIFPKFPKTFYFLTLEAFSFDKHRVDLFNFSLNSNSTNEGNIIIDSGTTLTYLPLFFYSQLESLVKKAMGNNTVPDPLGVLNLCYKISDKPKIPTISAHFSGATIRLKPINIFVQTGKDVTCLALASSGLGTTSLFGNIAQTNFLVGYDLVKKTVSFKPQRCGHVKHFDGDIF